MAVLALPRGWPDHVRSSLLHAIALASAALSVARSRRVTQGLRTDLERATHEIALLKEELAVKDARWSRLSACRRLHYTPVERMRILQLKAARRCSSEQAAEAMMFTYAKRSLPRPTTCEQEATVGATPTMAGNISRFGCAEAEVCPQQTSLLR